jgi:tetratricopeptide (TPR) repeat protein
MKRRVTDVFISYARACARQAAAVAALLRARDIAVWTDEDIPPHRTFGDVIAEHLEVARAVVVLWSEEAARSDWVRAEAEVARMSGKLVQLTLDGAPLPLPFSQIQCEDLCGWHGEGEPPAIAKVLGSVAELVGRARPSAAAAPASLDGRARIHLTLLNESDIASDIRAEIAAALGNQPALKILPDLKEAPDYRLEVQARMASGKLRATVRLLSMAGRDQLWSGRFEGEEVDLFDWQDRVTNEVAANVEAVVRRSELAIAARAPESRSARRMAASAAINSMTAAGFGRALGLLADELAGPDPDPEAQALGALAHASLWIGGYAGTGVENRKAGTALARAALGQTDVSPFPTGLSAVSLAQFGAPVEVSLALVDRILALTPGFAPGLMWAGQVRLIAGKADEAIARLEAAQRLDPRMAVRPLLLGYLGAARMLAGDLAAARAALLEATEVTGALPLVNLFLAATHGLSGDRDARADVLGRAAEIAPPADFRLPLVAAHAARLHEGMFS